MTLTKSLLQPLFPLNAEALSVAQDSSWMRKSLLVPSGRNILLG